VVARPHHLYTIWSETIDKEAPQPYELPRIAILVDGPANDCYAALGAIHTAWRPVAPRFKDFIAAPKNNLYRSLHTTVIGPDARAIEVQIRTEEMDRDAEFGIIAGFRFAPRGGAHAAGTRGRRQEARPKRSGAGARSGRPDQLDWLRNLVRWQEQAVDPIRFIESLRCDLSEDRVHIFVNGQRLLLPAGATPVDVAYALGPDVGDRCVAATVNGQLTFLSSPLGDGDVVEIHTEDTADGPSEDWLGFVRTPQAQLHLERRLGLRDGPEKAPALPLRNRAKIGLNAIRMELHWRERRLADDKLLNAVCAGLGYPDPHTLYVAVADHRISASEVVDRLIDQAEGTDGGTLAAAGPTGLNAPAARPATPAAP
jgi:GTP pyrophosphokinase